VQNSLEDSDGNISNFVLENVNGPIGTHNITNEGVGTLASLGNAKNLLQPNGFFVGACG
jgi:hypothetical protein